MLGIIRFLLSLSVVKAHIWPTGQPWLAWMSVFAFYTLSGYLMTLVLNEVYGFSLPGIKNFLLNRFLRLAPAYYLTIAFASIFIICISPLNNLVGALQLPNNMYEILTNVTVLGQTSFENSWMVQKRLSPSSWSLSVEIFCYILLAAGCAKTPRNLFMLLFLGAALSISSHYIAITKTLNATWEYSPFEFQNHYGVLQAGFIPFALGGLSYFYRENIKFIFAKRLLYLLLALCTCIAFTWTIPIMQYVLCLFLSAIIFSAAAPCLISIKLTGIVKNIDKLMGEMAYPIFLGHELVASIIALTFASLTTRSPELFIATVAGTMLFSLPIIKLDQRIQIIRQRLKTSNSKITNRELISEPAG